jgi:signal transduction histidine kinase
MRDDLAILGSVAIADRAQEQAAAHPHKAERELAWMRRVCLAFWGLLLYHQGYPPGFNAPWLTYFGGILYMLLLHWRLGDRKRIHATAWFGTIADSVLTFCMCLVTGGLHSVLVPFFYFTVLSPAFRYGVRETLGMLIFNASLIVTLFALQPENAGIEALALSLVYLGFAAGLGAMLAGWARDNLAIALAQSGALRLERDHSQTLLHRLIGVQEEERKRIAEDLHDRMGARLFTLRHGLDQCIRATTQDPATLRQLDALRTEADACSADVRMLMNELHPIVLDELGFYEALSELLAHIADIVPFTLETRLDPRLRKWRSRQDAMLFRLVQEALLNVRKHAEARHVRVRLEPVDADVVLTIEDDGRGFDPRCVSVGHYGLLTMRERASAAQGQLTIESQPLRGAKISVRLPLSSQP